MKKLLVIIMGVFIGTITSAWMFHMSADSVAIVEKRTWEMTLEEAQVDLIEGMRYRHDMFPKDLTNYTVEVKWESEKVIVTLIMNSSLEKPK